MSKQKTVGNIALEKFLLSKQIRNTFVQTLSSHILLISNTCTSAVLVSGSIFINAAGNASSQVSSPLTDNEMNMTNSIPRSVGTKLTCSPAAPMTPEELAEESQRKRDIRLRKNRYNDYIML